MQQRKAGSKKKAERKNIKSNQFLFSRRTMLPAACTACRLWRFGMPRVRYTGVCFLWRRTLHI